MFQGEVNAVSGADLEGLERRDAGVLALPAAVQPLVVVIVPAARVAPQPEHRHVLGLAGPGGRGLHAGTVRNCAKTVRKCADLWCGVYVCVWRLAAGYWARARPAVNQLSADCHRCSAAAGPHSAPRYTALPITHHRVIALTANSPTT